MLKVKDLTEDFFVKNDISIQNGALLKWKFLQLKHSPPKNYATKKVDGRCS